MTSHFQTSLQRLALTTLGLAWLCCGAHRMPAADLVDYHADIVPVLRDYCSGCHNDLDPEGGFSVETFAALKAGGETENKTMLVPGDPAASYLLQTMRHEAKPAMPPRKEAQPTKDEIDLLARWIEQGAKGPEPDHSLLSMLNVPDIPVTGRTAEPVTALAWSADGQWKAVGGFQKIRWIEVATGKVVREFTGEQGKVNSLTLSPDGKLLLSASGIEGLKGIATLRDVETGEVVRHFGEGEHRDMLYDAEFSPDGKLVATAGYDRVVRVWETATGQAVREFPSHTGAIFDLAFSPDGQVLASASADSTIKLWHVGTGERLDTLNQPQDEQYRVAFTPDGRHIVGAGADNRIRLWQFVSQETPQLNPVRHARFGHEHAILEMALSSDGRWLATSSADRALKLWSLPDLVEVGDLPRQQEIVSSLLLSPDASSLLVSRLDGTTETVALSLKPADGGQVAATDQKTAAPAPTESQPNMPATAKSPEAEWIELEEKAEGTPQTLTLGSRVSGVISQPGEEDDYAFSAKRGEVWVFEVDAARSESALDSKLAVLTAAGEPVERLVLQAVRDSWLTFRGKDSTISDDFRVHNWEEMELNEYLYVNGEVVKLWLYPRGPDSGFKVYPGFGSRHGFFETTPLSHALGQHCYIVRPLPAGTEPSPNGLPVFRLYYENDDESRRTMGSDSKLTFTVPEDGDYLVRLSDVRGFGGEGHHYRLSARRAAPGFEVEITGKSPKLSPGSSKELTLDLKRFDGFEGPVEVHVSRLPEGLSLPSPVVIEAGQVRAHTALQASPDFDGLSDEDSQKIQVTAMAEIEGRRVEKNLGHLGTIAKAPDAKLLVRIEPDGENGRIANDGVLELVVRPGGTVTALAVAERKDFEGRIDFGKEDVGRNLPFGVIVDNVGLNGLMIPEGKTEQRFFLTAAPWMENTERMFHLRTPADGGQGTQSVRLKVLAAHAVVAEQGQ